MRVLILLQRVRNFYRILDASQRMYFNVALSASIFILLKIITGMNEFSRSWLILSLLLLAITVFLDLLAVFKRVYNTMVGKGIILIVFSLCTALAISIAGQVINEVTGVEPTKFVNTVAILSILTIPFIFSLLMGVLFAICVVICVPLAIMYYFILDREVKMFLLPFTAHTENIRFLGFTRLIQLFSFGIFCGFIYGVSHHVIDKYSAFMIDSADSLVFNLEMYSRSPCELKSSTRGVLIDDEHVLVASKKDRVHIYTLESCVYKTNSGK